MAVPTILTSAVNDNKSKMFTHSTFNMNIEITGSKSTYSRCSGSKGHEG
jgi:hypothetical protein